MTNPQYLGDAVYVHVDDDFRLVLTTGHHEPRQASNVIVLEPEVVNALMNYINRQVEQHRSQRKPE